MNATSLSRLAEATRLTRVGRLTEATAFLQRMLQGRAAPHNPNPPAAPRALTIDGVAETIETAKAAPAPRTGPAANMGGGTLMQMSALRSFLERDDRVGLTPPLGGLAFPVPTEGTVVVPKGAQFLAAIFSNREGNRPYKLYVPSGYDGQPVPLIVMLHGCTQSPDDFAAGTRMNDAAEEHACLVVYPAQTSTANMSKCWNWFSAGDQQRDRGEPSLIAGITREVMSQYAVDPQRVYVAGLSAGAAAAAIMGATYPDLYAAIGVHSGLACGAASDLPSALAAMRQGKNGRGHRADGGSGFGIGRRFVPAIVFHGDQDTIVHPCNGDEVIAQSMLATQLERRVQEGRVAAGHRYSRALHANSSGETLLEHWVIHGAGHAWAGGSPAGSYTDPRGPDATREMLRFFFEHPLVPID
jgi:poly(hydroxyalkanoate) depolymerase family esterase